MGKYASPQGASPHLQLRKGRLRLSYAALPPLSISLRMKQGLGFCQSFQAPSPQDSPDLPSAEGLECQVTLPCLPA